MIDKYNKINTPEQLLEFMDNIEYGMKDEEGNIYKWDMDNFQEACQTKWKFKKGIDIVKLGYGHCWDQVEIERDWFIKHNYEFKTLFIMFENDLAPYICHTYLVYKEQEKNKWSWFEHADENNKGIHQFDTIEEAISAQKKAHIKLNKSMGLPINNKIIDTIHIYEYTPPKLGSSNQEFIDNILNHGKEITLSIK